MSRERRPLWPWSVLGLDGPADDRRAVKRAYAARLREIDPATEPDRFQALRSAYERALELSAKAPRQRRMADLANPQRAAPADDPVATSRAEATAPDPTLAVSPDRSADRSPELFEELLSKITAEPQDPSRDRAAPPADAGPDATGGAPETASESTPETGPEPHQPHTRPEARPETPAQQPTRPELWPKIRPASEPSQPREAPGPAPETADDDGADNAAEDGAEDDTQRERLAAVARRVGEERERAAAFWKRVEALGKGRPSAADWDAVLGDPLTARYDIAQRLERRLFEIIRKLSGDGREGTRPLRIPGLGVEQIAELERLFAWTSDGIRFARQFPGRRGTWVQQALELSRDRPKTEPPGTKTLRRGAPLPYLLRWYAVLAVGLAVNWLLFEFAP